MEDMGAGCELKSASALSLSVSTANADEDSEDHLRAYPPVVSAVLGFVAWGFAAVVASIPGVRLPLEEQHLMWQPRLLPWSPALAPDALVARPV